MPRTSDPWYWEARKAWYVNIKGKRHKLHEEEKTARREFHRLMALEDELDPKQRRSMSLADACEMYMARSMGLRQNSLILMERQLSRLAASPFRSQKLTAVDPDDVVRWIRGTDFSDGGRVKTDGNGARHVLFRYAKTLFRWARNKGLIDLDPFVDLVNPWKILPRDRVMSVEEYVAVMSRNRVSDEFKEVLEFVWRTGIRPGELSILSPRHLDTHMRVVRFQPTEHKTGTKTGLQREVHMPTDLWERLQGYRKLRPAGPLLVRANGKAWTTKAISNLWNQLKHSMGLKCVLYQARHAFATDMLERGNAPEVVARMMGHIRPDVLLSNYFHPLAERMQAAVEQNLGDAGDHTALIRARVEERKQEQLRKRREKNARWERKQKQERASGGAAGAGT